jgi:FixJ family two-component response regulator
MYVPSMAVVGRGMSESRVGHIGIIDDELLVREALKDCMESAGYSVETFGSAEEFFAAKSSRRASRLIVDIALPGISGLELQARLANLEDHVDIVFVTAHATDANRKRALRNGAAALLSKPVRCEELLTVVRTWCNNTDVCSMSSRIADGPSR